MSATFDVIKDGLASLIHEMSKDIVMQELLHEIGIGSVAKTKKKILANETILPPHRAAIRKENGITMVDNGRGYKSITHEVRKNQVAIGTNVEYMAINRDGVPEKGYKGRGYEYLFMLDQKEIDKIFETWGLNIIKRSTKKAGSKIVGKKKKSGRKFTRRSK
jgi:phage gpG-like protein